MDSPSDITLMFRIYIIVFIFFTSISIMSEGWSISCTRKLNHYINMRKPFRNPWAIGMTFLICIFFNKTNLNIYIKNLGLGVGKEIIP